MSTPTATVVVCNGAQLPKGVKSKGEKLLRLEYLKLDSETKVNVKLLLPDFVRQVHHLPDRVLDLCEIAAYIFAADRSVSRGKNDAVEFHAWARSFRFVIKVRDHEFWNRNSVGEKLRNALQFMSGDSEYQFQFLPGHSTPPASLFDKKECVLPPGDDVNVMLFSGGVDSLAGVLDQLMQTQHKICLVSHQSGQPGTVRTQDRLFNALGHLYRGRLTHYRFQCGLTGSRATEETQRTRSFLYTSVAYALSYAMKVPKFYVYENGVTAINFPRRQDLINARATRTTHPKTLRLLEDFFSEMCDSQVKIETPYLWNTKADVLQLLKDRGGTDLLTSTVSCSKTFQNLGQATHCGGCSQCIDRRFAAYAVEMDDIDEGGIYSADFIRGPLTDPDARTTLVDYVRQAAGFANWNLDHFYDQLLMELTDVVQCLPELEEQKAVEKVWLLCQRHGCQVLKSIRRMRERYDDPFHPLPHDSFLKIVGDREYLKEPVQRLIDTICHRLKKAVPIMFQSNHPKDERDFTDKVSGLLHSEKEKLDREHPAVAFASGHVVPDHSSAQFDLFIEYKFIRGKTTPSKASEGIAADLIKYPDNQHILAVIYDPARSISDDTVFKKDLESKRARCTVFIVR